MKVEHPKAGKLMLRRLLYWIGMTSVAPICFAVTVFLGDLYYSRPKTLADEKTLLLTALTDYKKAKGRYPVLPDRPLSDLKAELIRAGSIRADPRPEPDKDARYVSFDGRSYGLLFHINGTEATPSGSLCLVEIDTTSPTGWWGTPQRCPF